MRKLILGLAFAASAGPVWANEFEPAVRAYLDSQIRGWASDPVLIDAITRQNTRNANLTQADIDALDLAWRADVGAPASDLIDPVLTNEAAAHLRAVVEASGNLITEAFVMDALGLNVAASAVTSDMWQGDEEKFAATYPMGPDAVHIGEVEFDESTQTYQVQVSIPLVDPASGTAIGALTVALDAQGLM